MIGGDFLKKKLIFLILMVYLCSILSGCVKMSKKTDIRTKKTEKLLECKLMVIKVLKDHQVNL